MVQVGLAASKFEGTNKGFRSFGSASIKKRATATKKGSQGIKEEFEDKSKSQIVKTTSSLNQPTLTKESIKEPVSDFNLIRDTRQPQSRYTEQFYQSIQNQQGKVVGYRDTIARQSVYAGANKEFNVKDIERSNETLTDIKIQEGRKRQIEKEKPFIESLKEFPARVRADLKEQGYKDYGLQVLKGAGKLLYDFGKGNVGLFAESIRPNKEWIKFYERENPEVAKKLQQTDIKLSKVATKEQKTTAAIGDIFIPIGAKFPKVAQAVGLGFTGLSAFQTIKEPTPENIGATALIGGSTLAPVVLKGVKKGYVKIGSKYIPPEEVFSEQVLSQGKKVPIAKDIPQSFQSFSRSNIVSTASPQKISGTTVSIGKKASFGLEDPGIYVTPKGEGSPAFLRISGAGQYEFTINPIKAISEKIKSPTVTEFETTGITRYPKSVLEKPGFTSVAEYQQKVLSKTGEAVITKRSEVGLGNIPRQYMTATKETPSFWKLDVIREGQKVKLKPGELIKKGDVFLEPGTKELEAVIPIGSKFAYTPKTIAGKIKGFDYYTKFEGELVGIRQAKLLFEKRNTVLNQSTKPKTIESPKEVIITGEQVAAESSLSSISKPTKFIGDTRGLGGGSLISSPSTPSKIIYPSIPSTPSKISYPSTPSRPSTPSIPSIPSRPSIPSTPSKISYPSIPSRPSTPSRPSKISYPSTPSTTSKISYPYSSSFNIEKLNQFQTPKFNLNFKNQKPVQSKKKKKINTKRPFTYSPTLNAIIGNIKGKGRTKGVLSGLEQRPI